MDANVTRQIKRARCLNSEEMGLADVGVVEGEVHRLPGDFTFCEQLSERQHRQIALAGCSPTAPGTLW